MAHQVGWNATSTTTTAIDGRWVGAVAGSLVNGRWVGRTFNDSRELAWKRKGCESKLRLRLGLGLGHAI